VPEIQTNEVELAFTGPCGLPIEIAFVPGTAVQMTLETADTPPLHELDNNIGLRATAFFREPGSYLVPDLKPGRYRLSLFRRKVPNGKGSEKQDGPTHVTEVILVEGTSPQTLKFEL